MDLAKIVTIAGMPGLYKIISKTQNSLVVESLTDKKRFPVFASHQTTSLEDISVFTTDEDLPLKKVLKKISDTENKGPAIDSKEDEKKLKEYFEKVLPEYDKNKVYYSHIKKIISWYNLLQSLNILDFTEEEKEENPDDNKEQQQPDESPIENAEVKEKAKNETTETEQKPLKKPGKNTKTTVKKKKEE